MKIYDVLIVGAGASGLFFASHLPKNLKIAILDTNPKIAQKLRISGGGRCNFTNTIMSYDNFLANGEFVEYFLDNFTKDDMLKFMKAHNIEVEIKKDRYYFCKNSSNDLLDVLKKLTTHADFYLNTQVLSISKDELFNINTIFETFMAKKVVVASGAKSFSNLGASDIGLDIAKSFNIKTKDFTPALVGLTLQKEQFWMRELSGLSTKVAIDIDGKKIVEDMLFTHKGISGPAVLSASLYWQKGTISIDFLPVQNILELIKNSKKLLSTQLPLPSRLSKALLEALSIKDEPCDRIKDTQSLQKLHSYEFAPAGNFGFSKAEVCKGGVLSSELNPFTLESLDVSGLYFIGEVVDVTGELGGYNIQWAFSSAFVCANSM
ncbi:MAG: aminoacetone oxidase family FAD-binding enzyme [Sulfurimonas sp.]|jgi:predicted Rossmann fold flavoprotein|nr:aminoacetone oxidase family FAD-binding enzyme [Sulfurimonadaceae bacterium]